MGIAKNKKNSFTELAFENRNKQYGAYVIRSEYDLSLIKSFILAMCGIAGLIALFRFSSGHAAPEKTVPDPGIILETPMTLQPKQKQKITVDPAPSARHQSPVSTSVPLVTDSVVALKKDSTITTDPGPGPQSSGSGTAHADTASGHGTSPDGPDVASKEPVNIPDSMPEFPGGEKKLIEYLSTHIKYPGDAVRMEVSGTVLLKFVVSADGTIGQIEVVKKLGHGCEDEARRVVEHMPRWKPGRFHNRAVPVYFYLPVTYRLQ